MLRDWWRLPGPSAFARGCVNDLREGRSVVAVLPKHSPPGLLEMVRAELVESGWRCRSLNVDVDSARAPTYAAASAVLDGNACEIASPDQLADVDGLGGTVVFLRGDGTHWRSWSAFLADYMNAVRVRARDDRMPFMALVEEGPYAAFGPRADVALSIRRYAGAVRSIDMRLLAAQVTVGASPRVAREQELRAELLAGLALWDPDVVVALASEETNVLLDPVGALCAFAGRRGWSPVTGEEYPEGSCQDFDGRKLVHSAMLALTRDGLRELEARVWRAQVTVLLPLIEERRLELIERGRPFIRLPVETTFGVITDPLDLDPGPLHWQLQAGSAPRRLQTLAAVVRRVRNRLAHRQRVPADELTSSEWQWVFGSAAA